MNFLPDSPKDVRLRTSRAKICLAHQESITILAMTVDRTADLCAALGFVVGRIEEEAMRSGEPLSGEERLLLNDLPKHSEYQNLISAIRNRPFALFRGT